MSRFVNKATQVVFSVDDSKDDRYSSDQFESASEKKAPAKKAVARKSN